MQDEASKLPAVSEYLPASHAMQWPRPVRPSSPDHVPATQSMQSSSASLPGVSKYVPTLQLMQSDASSLPVVDKNLPATQSIQSAAPSLPVTSTYLPTTQSMQPDTYVQAGSGDAETVMTFWHSVGLERSVTALQRSVLDPASSPSLTMHCAVAAWLPTTSAYLPIAHRMQFDSWVRRTASTYLPTAQSVQLTWPSTS